MDPSLLVAVVSIATAIVTTSGGVAIAILTNRREAENAADDSRELTLRERIVLRDEKIKDRDEKITRLEAENARLRAENARLKGKPDA